MGTKKFKPNTPGLRQRQTLDFESLTTDSPEKSLVKSLKKHSGRTNSGRISVRRRGGGVRRRYRDVDFKRNQTVDGIIKSIEYDPNRSANIALVYNVDGSKIYIIAPANVKVGQRISNGEKSDITPGNCLPLKDIPTGAIIHNIELSRNKGGQIARSAGASAVLMAKNDKFATVKLPSGEVRLINVFCRATIGTVGNSEHRNTSKGKAGVNRWLGRRPKVRGSVMNPCDHPHGGGEGKAPIGRPGPVTPWGKPTLGYKTRDKKKHSNKYIVKRRK